MRFSLRTLALAFVVLGIALYVPRHRSLTQHLAANRLSRKGVEMKFRERAAPQSLVSRLIFGDDKYDFVDVIWVKGISLSSAEIDGLRSFRGVEDCTFNQCPTTDLALRAVKQMERLEVLHVEGTTISTNGVDQLRGLKELENLRIIDTPLDGVNLSFLSTLPRLRTLSLRGQTVDDAVLVRVADCSELTFLGIEDASITDRGLAPLQRLNSLSSLVIRESSGVSGVGLGALAPLSKLDRLDLEESAITDEGLRHIARIRSLRTIRLHSTKVTEAGLAELQQSLPNCHVLWKTE